MQRKTSKTPTLTLTAALMAALGVANLSPVQLTATGVALGLGLVATPAFASLSIPGVGVIIKRKPGNAPIVAPGDNNGVVRHTGLEPGEYEVGLIGEDGVTSVKVGRDGQLITVALAEDDGSKPHIEVIARAGNPVAWCKPLGELCPALRKAVATSDVFDTRALFASDLLLPAVKNLRQRRVDPVALKAGFIDVNTSSADEIVRLAPTTSSEGAAFIVAERDKGSAFKDPIDFAQRVCPKVSVDFDLAPTRMGNAQIIARGGDPKSAGFKCAPPRKGEDPTLELYGRKHSYVGHVTLLR
jgi:hypothetical protein